MRETAQVLLDHETVSGMALEALLTPVLPIELEDVRLNGAPAGRVIRRASVALALLGRAVCDRVGRGAALAPRAARPARGRAVPGAAGYARAT